MSRRVLVRVHPGIIEGMMFASLPGVWHRTDRGLPEGAKCVGRGLDWERQLFWFVFEHESFAEVPDGEMLPEFRGVELSAFCFDSVPLSSKTTAEMERLITEQVEHYKNTEKLIDEARRSAFSSGSELVLNIVKPPEIPPDFDGPHVAGG